MRALRKDRVRTRAADDSGYVLLVVLGVGSVLTLLALSAFILSQQSVTDMRRAVYTQNAFQAAEAGLDMALARLTENPTAAFDWPLIVSVGEATCSVTAMLTPGSTSTTYTVTSIGTYRDVTQTVSQRYVQRIAPAFSLWDKNVFPDAGLSAVNGWSTTNFWGPVYTAGDFSVAGLGGLPGSVATRQFNNNVYVYNGQSYIKKGVDSTYAPMNLLANAPQTEQNPITGAGFSTWSADCPLITLPAFGVIELRSAWNTVTVDGRIPVWAPEPSSLQPGMHPLTITARTVDTTYSVVAGTTRLKWTRNGGNGRGLLTVSGVVYVDGDLTLPSCNYTGNGTLIVRGNVTLNGRLLPKTGELLMNSPPEYTPLSQAEVLGIVTPFNMTANPGPGSNTRKDFKGDFGMAGAFYVGGTVRFTSNNNRVKGSFVAGGCNADGHNVHLVVDPDLPAMLPPEMPGGTGTAQTVTFVRLFNTWSRR